VHDDLIDYTLLQQSLDSFWGAFTEEYLLSLRRHYLRPTEPPTLNELVIIVDPNQPRHSWKLGRVTRIIQGRDNIVRTAEVTLLDDRNSVFTRAIQRLIPLERDLLYSPGGEDVAAPPNCRNSTIAPQAINSPRIGPIMLEPIVGCHMLDDNAAAGADVDSPLVDTDI